VIVVALINNPKNVINGVYVFLIIVAFTIFLFLAIRPFLSWLVRRSSKDQVASQPNMFILFMLVFTASFFTQAVGVHAIFGAFLVGLITPHENGFAIAIAEKLEDLVTIILIPIYFGLSGLQTNLLNLDDANAWGVVFLVILVAVTGKVVGCYVGARLSKVEKRESLAIGILMNTKGLVELIVLNLGLQGGVITPKIFSIFVIMALFTTFMVYMVNSRLFR
jgi:Kef-type K+ transport system membrane component KefB